jgi:hypothetical protein
VAFGHDAVLRVVLAPGRADETVVSLDKMDEEEFRHSLVALGTDRQVGVFHRNMARTEERGRDSLVITQGREMHGLEPGAAVRLELGEDGWVVLDANVTGTSARGAAAGLSTFAPIEVEAIRDRARPLLEFHRRLFEVLDPYNRHVGFLVNASLRNLGHRNVVFRRDAPRPGASVTLAVGRDANDALVAFARPERVSRSDIGWVDQLADRLAKRIERVANTNAAGEAS